MISTPLIFLRSVAVSLGESVLLGAFNSLIFSTGSVAARTTSATQDVSKTMEAVELLTGRLAARLVILHLREL